MRRRTLATAVAAASAAALAASLAVTAPAQAATTAGDGAIRPVAAVDVQRYLGDWYQLADLPQWYEAFCLSGTRARYGLNADGTVSVANRCTGPFGTTIPTNGTARVLDPGTNARLQVSFLSFAGRPIFTGSTPNYVIIGLADDYSWAVVGDPSRSSAYLLSRTVTLDAARLAAAKGALSASGYDPCSLTVTPQPGGATAKTTLC